ncbi:GH35 family endo-1,4-beta-xylanase [Agromyces flavus]|uniref:Beta-xylanase n=1 Tax=Agromyces flavus TaxID=589382 RepID=A0A1H1VKN8_9MICO|nr:endo-1,4-beta-xylanase [Agromyces flavus]MCP2365944.1 GH35 family endo-1,4-beta-xylanase [Agromyces flavus]GGI43693.1 beta-xylanase [Agromyces flavus]SDS84609.1 Endo-1,4-beta-xylanase, GH35 family [Agromyces flavus]
MTAVVAAPGGPEHRFGTTTLTLTAPDGTPLADTDVTVEQTRHAFTFGNIGFDLIDLANGRGRPGDDELGERYVELFNAATLPFYWRDFEPEPGRPRTEELRRAAEWFRDRGIAVKGHPLAWHTLAPRWLLDRPLDEIEATLRNRIRRDVTDFAGLIDTWDAINEVVIMPVFEAEDNAITPLARERGRIHVVRLAFEEARAANPGATLLLNDFDLSSAYERLIEEVLDAGIRLDAIGLQTHMHQGFRGEDALVEIADRFARFGLPLHFTETSLVSGELMPAYIEDLNDWQVDEWPSTPEGEAQQADELERHYRALVGHPAVEAITYWGITDRGAWLNAPIGLLRADGTPKPSFDAVHALVKGEWWLAPTTVRTDAAGRVSVRGFAGDYVVREAGTDDAPRPFAIARGVADAASVVL